MKRRPKKPDGSFSRGTVQAIVDRDQGRCAWCHGLLLGERGPAPWQWQVHHRLARGGGGTSEPHIARASNGVALHGTCHAAIESERKDAEGKGFIIRHGIELPRMVPIQHAVHGLVRLRDDGTYDREEWK